MARQFGIPVTYKNKLDFIRKVIDVHLTLKPTEENLVENARKVLAYYIIYGYSKKTVKDLETTYVKLKPGYIRTINSHLRSAGFLVKDKNNKQKSHLSKEMENYRNQLIKNDGRTLTIGFLTEQQYKNLTN